MNLPVMENTALNVQELDTSKNPVTTKINQAPKNQRKQGGIGPIQLAYLMLVEAAHLNSQSAMITSQNIKTNGTEQQFYNKEDRAHYKYIENKTTYHHHWTVGEWIEAAIGIGGAAPSKWTTNNNAEVFKVDEENKKIEAHNEVLGKKLNLLQQQASIKMRKASASIDTAVQFIQAASKFVNILKSETFSALLRKPVQ